MPDVTVVIVWLDHPLSPVKVKLPTAALLIMVRVKLGSFALVKVQVMVCPETLAILAEGIVNTLPESEEGMLALV